MRAHPLFSRIIQTRFPALIAAITPALLFNTTNSLAINKCVMNGSTTYTDQPCPAEANSSPLTLRVIPPDDPVAAHQRYLDNKKKLDQIYQQKARDEYQQQRDAKAAAHQYNLAKDKEYLCKKLDLKRKAAQQHQSELKHKGTRKQSDQAQLQVQQAADDYANKCN